MLHLAIWFDETKPPSQQVVVCSPAMETESTALVALKSALHAQHPALIVSGEGDVMESFIGAIDQEDEGWKTIEAAVQGCLKLAENHGLDLVWLRKPVGLATSYVGAPVDPRRPENAPSERPPGGLLATAARKKKKIKATKKSDKSPPRPGLYPLGISEPGKVVWDLVTMRDVKRIREEAPKITRDGKPIERMWAMAFQIWRRECAERKIAGFAHSHDSEPDRDRAAA